VLPTTNTIKMKEIDRSESMFDRDTFLGGIMAIGIGIIIFIIIKWIEPLLNDIVHYQWIILIIRIVGVIFILLGIVGIIAAFLRKKEEIEQEQK
jgi:quinol-cytochrome oxidoreductase complex cytochrome b subunit